MNSSDRAVLREPEAACPDRELLELAALAYWGDEIDDVCSIRWLEEDQAIGYTHGDNQDHNGIDQEYLWNPLADDGDALRLAVQLRIEVVIFSDTVVPSRAASWKKGAAHCSLWEPESDDPFAAARRAIVRAAAQIGSDLRKAASGCSYTARSDDQSKVDDQEPTAGSSHG